MTVKVTVTADGQITLPAEALEALGVKPGDQLHLETRPDGFVLRLKRIDYSRLGTLRDKIPADHPPFDIRKFREQPYDPSLRD